MLGIWPIRHICAGKICLFVSCEVLLHSRSIAMQAAPEEEQISTSPNPYFFCKTTAGIVCCPLSQKYTWNQQLVDTPCPHGDGDRRFLNTRSQLSRSHYNLQNLLHWLPLGTRTERWLLEQCSKWPHVNSSFIKGKYVPEAGCLQPEH